MIQSQAKTNEQPCRHVDPPTKSFRIVGLGSIGMRYLSIIRKKFPGAIHLVPITRPVEGMTDRVSLEVLEDYQSWPRVDMTIVASNTLHHLEHLQHVRGSSDVVLVEKPLCVSTTQLRDFPMEDPSDVFVSSPFRFTRAFDLTRRLIPQLGGITSVLIECRSWLPEWRTMRDFRTTYSADPQQGGVLLDLVHEIDIALQLFSKPSFVSAILRSSGALKIPVETSSCMTWRYESFDICMILDFASRGNSRSAQIFGENGSLKWNLLTGEVMLEHHPSQQVEIFENACDLDRDQVFLEQIHACLDPLKQELMASFNDGVNAINLVDAAKRSDARSGRLVRVQHDSA